MYIIVTLLFTFFTYLQQGQCIYISNEENDTNPTNNKTSFSSDLFPTTNETYMDDDKNIINKTLLNNIISAIDSSSVGVFIKDVNNNYLTEKNQVHIIMYSAFIICVIIFVILIAKKLPVPLALQNIIRSFLIFFQSNKRHKSSKNTENVNNEKEFETVPL